MVVVVMAAVVMVAVAVANVGSGAIRGRGGGSSRHLLDHVINLKRLYNNIVTTYLQSGGPLYE